MRRQQRRALAERLVPDVHGGTYAGLLDGHNHRRGPTCSCGSSNFKGLAVGRVPLAMLPLIEYIWSVIADPTRPTLVVLDEAGSLLNNPASARLVAEATRTGRHHGIITLNPRSDGRRLRGAAPGGAVIDNASVSPPLAPVRPRAAPGCSRSSTSRADERANGRAAAGPSGRCGQARIPPLPSRCGLRGD